MARETAEAELNELQVRIAPLQSEINQLGRQFWVDKKRIVGNKYDLSANRYRDIEEDHVFYEDPTVTLERLRKLEQAAQREVAALDQLLT